MVDPRKTRKDTKKIVVLSAGTGDDTFGTDILSARTARFYLTLYFVFIFLFSFLIEKRLRFSNEYVNILL